MSDTNCKMIDIDFESACTLLCIKMNELHELKNNYTSAKSYGNIPSWLLKMKEKYAEVGKWLNVCDSFYNQGEL